MLPGWTAAAVAMFAAAFDPPVNVSQSTGNSFYPNIAVERAGPTPGAFRVFWHDFTPVPVALGCIAHDRTAYGPPSFCALSAEASRTPRAATDSLGRTHLVWGNADGGGQREIFYALWDRAAWSVPINLSNNAGDR